MFRIRPNIIKRTFSHHHTPTKFPVSSFVNHFDRKTMEETNKNVNELLSKIHNINNKIHNINNEIDHTQFFIILNFIITGSMGICLFIGLK